MNITIGEVINELIPYCNVVETKIHHDLPYVRALLSSEYTTRGYIYVVQTNENIYSSCDDINDLHGNRFIPTGSKEAPFAREGDIINFKYGTSNSHKTRSEVKNVKFSEFLDYLYDRLMSYDIIRSSKGTLDSKVSDLGFTSVKIKRILDETFASKNCRSGTIRDLIDIVNKRGDKFDIGDLKQRELNCVVGKLKDIGIIAEVDELGCINHVIFDTRRKNYESNSAWVALSPSPRSKRQDSGVKPSRGNR